MGIYRENNLKMVFSRAGYDYSHISMQASSGSVGSFIIAPGVKV